MSLLFNSLYLQGYICSSLCSVMPVKLLYWYCGIEVSDYFFAEELDEAQRHQGLLWELQKLAADGTEKCTLCHIFNTVLIDRQQRV